MIVPRAALFIPRGVAIDRWLPSLTEIAAAEGWAATTLVREWGDLAALLKAGEIEIGLAPSWEHLPPNRTPRIVTAADYQPAAVRPRRPRINWSPSPAMPLPRRPVGSG